VLLRQSDELAVSRDLDLEVFDELRRVEFLGLSKGVGEEGVESLLGSGRDEFERVLRIGR
jgi:hypothetical protein